MNSLPKEIIIYHILPYLTNKMEYFYNIGLYKNSNYMPKNIRFHFQYDLEMNENYYSTSNYSYAVDYVLNNDTFNLITMVPKMFPLVKITTVIKNIDKSIDFFGDIIDLRLINNK